MCRRNFHASFLSGVATNWGDGKLGRPVFADDEVGPAFGRLYFSNVDVKGSDGCHLRRPALGLVAVNIRQAQVAGDLGVATRTVCR